MLIVGLTGGIASGKSTASKFFHNLRVPVFDADVIVHDLIQPGNDTYAEVVKEFGPEIVQSDGTIDKAKLRTIIFSSQKHRRQLESIIHPKVRKRLKKNIAQTDTAYCIVCIPLLVETHQQDLVQRILVIDTPKEIQIERLKKRDTISSEQANNILAAQASRDERLAAANDVIMNNAGIENFYAQLNNMHENYLALAKNSNNSLG